MVVEVVVVEVDEVVEVVGSAAVVLGAAVTAAVVVVGANVSVVAPSVSLQAPPNRATNTSIKAIRIKGRLMRVVYTYTSPTDEGGLNVSDNDPNDDDQDLSGQRIAGGAILGTGLGAAVGAVAGDLGTGIWIGAVIGVGAAFVWNASGR